jgi:hypothetical protein
LLNILICLQIAFLSLLSLERFDNDVGDCGTDPLHRCVILVVGTLGHIDKRATMVMAIHRET